MTEVTTVLQRRYRNLRKIGEGAMGEVWQGTDPLLERPLAIKLMRADLASQPEAHERFMSEAISLARLSHAHIVPLYDFVKEDGLSWMVMEFVPGQSLDHILDSRTRLPWVQACELMIQALAGLEHAHKAGIIHRDIKPSNMMVTNDGVLKIMDFGIARISQRMGLTRTGLTIGTLAYMSPEQIHGKEADVRSDLYAVAVVLFQLITGRLPLDAQSDTDIMRHHLQGGEALALERHAPGVPASLAKMVRRALAADPARRFQSARDMQAALSDLVHSAQTGTDRAVAPSASGSWPLGSRRLWQATGGLVVVLFAAVGAAVWFTQPGSVTPLPSSGTVQAAAPVMAAQKAPPAAPSAASQPTIDVAAMLESAKARCDAGMQAARTQAAAHQWEPARKSVAQALEAFSACEGAQELLLIIAHGERGGSIRVARQRPAGPALPPANPYAPGRSTEEPRGAPAEPLRTVTAAPSVGTGKADAAVGDQQDRRRQCLADVNNAWLEYRRDDPAKAARLAREALKLDPSCPDAERLLRVVDSR